MAMIEIPPADILRKLLDYDPATGVLTWKHRPRKLFSGGYKSGEASWKTWNTRYAGKPCTDISSSGYIRVNIFGTRYVAHRIIWCMMTGNEPANEIDHINGNRTDNRWCNLREVDRTGNMKNLATRNDNKTGVIGVSFCNTRQRYLAIIYDRGKRIHLGYFSTVAEAADARRLAEVQYGYHANHGR